MTSHLPPPCAAMKTEKMAALKRAYADMILNTAKEAATRILGSERKAVRLQQELLASKEEALNVLLRLKQQMDLKISELERESLGQRKRVQELELQLTEAEGMVKNLRMELKRAHDELGWMKYSHVKLVDQEVLKRRGDVPDDLTPEKKLHTSDSIDCPLVSTSEHVSTSDSKDASQNQRSADDCHCSSMFEDATTHAELFSAVLPGNDHSASNPELPAIIMRSKEPAELYKNGCTQRIHALGQNMHAGKLPLAGKINSGCSNVNHESFIGECVTAEQVCTVDSTKAENVTVNLTRFNETVERDRRSDEGQVVKFFRRHTLRKKKARCNTGRTPAQAIESHEQSNIYSCSGSSPCSQGNVGEYEANLSSAVVEEANNDLDPHFSLRNSTTSQQNRSAAEIIAEGCVQTTGENFQVLIGESLLARQDSGAVESSDVSTCKANLGTAEIPSMNSGTKDEKACKTVGVPNQSVSDGLLKYTFRRKRRREPLGSQDNEVLIEKKNSSRRRTGDKQSASKEPQKPTQVMESSRDNRRIVQVARQLISLSGKRW